MKSLKLFPRIFDFAAKLFIKFGAAAIIGDQSAAKILPKAVQSRRKQR